MNAVPLSDGREALATQGLYVELVRPSLPLHLSVSVCSPTDFSLSNFVGNQELCSVDCNLLQRIYCSKQGNDCSPYIEVLCKKQACMVLAQCQSTNRPTSQVNK